MSAEAHIEGRRAVTEAILAEVPLSRVLVTKAARQDRGLSKALASAVSAGVSVLEVAQSRLDAVSEGRGSHQGVIAFCEPFAYSSLKQLLRDLDGRRQALLIVLDHVQDPGNLGAIARSADVVGADGIVIANRRAASVTSGAYKASAGALSYVKVAREPNLAACCRILKDEGFWVIGASEKAESSVWDVSFSGRVALVMGSEESGISRLVSEQCDCLCRLPQKGHVQSLNVASAATAMLFEWLRRKETGGV